MLIIRLADKPVKGAVSVVMNRGVDSLILGQGLDISSELGLRPLAERVVALHERAKSLFGSYPDGLTSREVQVLRLIATA